MDASAPTTRHLPVDGEEISGVHGDAPAVPVLEIGGTHVTAALVTTTDAPRVRSVLRLPLTSADPAEALVERLVEASSMLGAPSGRVWGVAIPGPFDYERGIGLFTGVGKFDALNGFPLGEALCERLVPAPAAVRFLNDADAFGLGEQAAGAARGHARAVCLTLGTGIGSAFVADGVPVNDGPEVPPQGSAHLLSWGGRPLEDTVSRRALRSQYADATGTLLDVDEIADRARAGDAVAAWVFETSLRCLGRVIAPYLVRFDATVLVVGGSIAGSWDLVSGPLRAGLEDGGAGGVGPTPARHPQDAPLYGAAQWAVSSLR